MVCVGSQGRQRKQDKRRIQDWSDGYTVSFVTHFPVFMPPVEPLFEDASDRVKQMM